MRYLALLAFLAASGCARDVDVPVNVTSRAPNVTLTCVSPRVRKLPVRSTAQATPDGWRMWLEVFSGPPDGWYSKGRIEHADGMIFYAPDSATAGISTQDVLADIRPILRQCSRR